MTTLTQKCQVTIPKQFRQAVGLRAGDEVEFAMENNTLVVHKKPKKLPFDKWKGILQGYNSKKFNEEFR